jgi:hypothetical protein
LNGASKAALPFSELLTAHSPTGNTASVTQGWRESKALRN